MIPGQNLEEAVDRFRKSKYREKLCEAFVGEIAKDLFVAVRACHDAGYGHGDLSERNVMISEGNSAEKRKFSAVLIDFDNASYKPELLDLDEQKLIEKDVRSVSRLLGLLTFETRWHENIQDLLRSCSSVRELQEAFQFALRVTKGIRPHAPSEYNESHWSERLQEHLAIMLAGGRHLEAIGLFMNQIAQELDVTNTLASARSTMEHRIRTDRNYLKGSVSMHVIYEDVEEAARRLLK
ncbi:MAG: hypothetical protein FWD69_19435 [Polyangiaceae bacterium]|nr:hypothetical protein [Polyangiaceae bacterium]